MVGGFGSLQLTVIIFLAISKSVRNMYLWSELYVSRGIAPSRNISGSNGEFTCTILSVSSLTLFQNSWITGQSQNIWEWSPMFPHFLQHNSTLGSFTYLEITSGVLKYLIFNFQSNSLHNWLLSPLWQFIHSSSHTLSVIITFNSNSHFPLRLSVFCRVSFISLLYICETY